MKITITFFCNVNRVNSHHELTEGETRSIFFSILQELKQKQKEGKPLELNQLEKLKSEQEVLKKIQELKLGA